MRGTVMATLTLPSYAKINLGLLIHEKRPDGYHEIETVLHQIALQDVIEFGPCGRDEIVLTTGSDSVPGDSSNLCVKAALALKKHHAADGGARIHLEKNVPVGAGLGGGSSNAATVLLGLNRLWGLRLTAAQLRDLAAELGSDVPFFIEGGTALATGRGEILEPLSVRDSLAILVVYPRIAISTAWAYDQLNLSLTRTNKSVRLSYFNNLDLAECDLQSSLINQFEDAILPAYPVIDEIKAKLYENHAVYASMSGSGSAVYGMFEQLIDAKKSAMVFKETYQCFLTRHIHWGYGQI